MIEQTLFLIGISVLGGVMTNWMRRFELHGLEPWLPLGIIVTYAMGPMAGFIVAMSIISISFVLFPYPIHWLGLMAVCLAVTFYLARFFPVTEATFFMNAMLLTVIYLIISTITTTITGYPLNRTFKLVMLAFFFCWLIFSRLGWDLMQWLATG